MLKGHVNDMDKLDRKKDTGIRNGSINYAQILKEGKKAGIKYFIVEQESFTCPFLKFDPEFHVMKIMYPFNKKQ